VTNGQVAQLRELAKCWNLPRWDARWVIGRLALDEPLGRMDKALIRKLRHVYRNQIAAMKKNRGKA
jgi:hypothetical protein